MNPMSNPTLNVLQDPVSRELESIYAQIPKIVCQRKCQIACGKIDAEEAENERLRRQHGKYFGQVWSDQIFAGDGRVYCEFLSAPNGDCTVYPLRPLMCRLFGVSRDLVCPHGCVPERWLERSDVMDLVWRIQGVQLRKAWEYGL